MIFRALVVCLLAWTSTSIAQTNKYKLGQALFFDKVLSGNKNISCATCHSPLTATGDGMSLGFGEGAKGLGVMRSVSDKIHARIPRNSPALFNAGASFVTNYFYDGRVEFDQNFPGGFKTPAGMDLPLGLDSLLAAQALFPLTSDMEMAGQGHENDISVLAEKNDLVGVWEVVKNRVVNIPEYVEMFKAAYPNEVSGKSDIKITHLANAIADFEEVSFKADDSPYDRYLAGERSALSNKQIRGMYIFNGKGKCATCHQGRYQSDFEFHSIALPQIGPGKGVGYKGSDDFGRSMVTGQSLDKYKFRTPSLRNVMVTAPYGHNGAYDSLKDMIVHHLYPVSGLMNYKIEKANLPNLEHAQDEYVLNNRNIMTQIANSSNLPEVKLTNTELDDLMAFLSALTDERCLDMRATIPKRVPSNLPVFD